MPKHPTQIQRDEHNNVLNAKRVDLVGSATINSVVNTEPIVSVATIFPDGANLMPSMDDKARAGFQKITDGTNIADVEEIANSTTNLEGKKGLVANSAIYGRISNSVVRQITADSSTHAIVSIDYPHHKIHSGNHYYLEGFTTLNNTDTLYVKLVTPDTAKWGHFKWEIESSGILETNFYENASGGMAGGVKGIVHANNRNSDCWEGAHTGGNNEATVLTDSTQSWTVDALIGMQVFNETDKSSAFITDNDATTVTVSALTGGTDNDWDTGDIYEINNSQMVVTSGVAVATTKGLKVSSKKVGGTGFKTVSGGTANREDEIVLKQNTTYFREFISGSDSNVIAFRANWYEHTDKN